MRTPSTGLCVRTCPSRVHIAKLSFNGLFDSHSSVNCCFSTIVTDSSNGRVNA